MSAGERRLVAIMFTDMVGYTALGQRNEALSLTLVEEQRKLVRPVLARHKGREVKTIGDAFLIEFPSAVDAVRCAYDIQRAVREFNLSLEAEKRIHLRIGIHVGEAIEDPQGDISGDAVNVASRIEALAEDGGVCLTRQVYDHVRNKLEFPMPSIGPRSLKNVSEPIEVYRMVLPWQEDEEGNAPKQTAADKRRIAVLPFDNISPDHGDAFFADGMTEEIIAAISQVHDLRVIARTSTSRYRGAVKSVSEISRELGAGSVLEGSVRKAGNRVRITVQLIDAATEDHVWSESYERQLDDIFSIQTEIAKHVSEALKVRLLSTEEVRLSRKVTENSAAFVLYLKGRTAMRGRDENGLKEAKTLFEEAVSLDPDYARAYVGLADAYFLLGEYYYLPTREANATSKETLRKALRLDDDLPEARTSLANLLQHEYRFSEAVAEYKRALALNPSYSQCHHWYSICLWDMGRIEDASGEMRKAEELDPMSAVVAYNVAIALAYSRDKKGALGRVEKLRAIDPSAQYADLAMSYILYRDGDLDGALRYQRLAQEKKPGDMWGLARLGMLCGMTGRKEEARGALDRIAALPDGILIKHHQIAMVYAGLGENEEVFRELEKAFSGQALVHRVLRFQFPRGVREDPRFASFFTRVGLPVPHDEQDIP